MIDKLNAAKQNSITVLGCGGSSGCPVLCCECDVCTKLDVKNIRTRTSAFLQLAGRAIVIDTGPDFRQQALREKINKIDAVIYTHPHSDHINGIDELRAFCYSQKQSIPLFGNQFTMNNLTTRFDYCFSQPSQLWDKPSLLANVLTPGWNQVLGIDVYLFELPHGSWQTACYRIGNMAWMTDISQVTESVIEELKGLDYLFLDCLMDFKVPSHLNVVEAMDYATRIAAKQTYFVHLTHRLDYHTLMRHCPSNMAVAYDGLKILL